MKKNKIKLFEEKNTRILWKENYENDIFKIVEMKNVFNLNCLLEKK